MKLAKRATVFIGSSTPALNIADAVRKGLSRHAEVMVWDKAFDPGTWLLGGILNMARQADFAVFVIRKDDTTIIRNTEYSTVRDNVLFEAGIFMGALGPERTFLLWPTTSRSKPLRLPSDLQGLLRIEYKPPENDRLPADLKKPLEVIREQIEKQGRALRSGYNEIAALKQTLHERDIDLKGGACEGLGEIIDRAARRRARPWYLSTSVDKLMGAIETHYHQSVVDDVFWWLILYGVITFDNIDYWNDGDWTYKDSIAYATFTERGVVLLNDFRAAPR